MIGLEEARLILEKAKEAERVAKLLEKEEEKKTKQLEKEEEKKIKQLEKEEERKIKQLEKEIERKEKEAYREAKRLEKLDQDAIRKKTREEMKDERNKEKQTEKEKTEAWLKEKEEYIYSLRTSLFSDFLIRKNEKTNTSLIFLESDNCLEFVCSVNDFTPSMFYSYLFSKKPQEAREVITKLQCYIRPEDISTITPHEAFTQVFNFLLPVSSFPIETYRTDLHPVVVQGCDVASSRKIPFHESPSSFGGLNPYLQDFLSRTPNHEYLCAILWLNFIGIKSADVIYLMGPGGDGKSGFVAMLQDLCQGSYAEFDLSDLRFGAFACYNKALLIVNENRSTRIMSNATLLKISGGDRVNVEEKGKTPFQAQLRGQIIIVSNVQPKTLGSIAERRRLRFFNIKPSNIRSDEILNADDYEKELGSTPNEFLNYMRECYEKHKTSKNLVKELPNAKEIIEGLLDEEQICIFNRALVELKSAGYELNSNGVVDCSSVSSIILKNDSKNKFAIQNFEEIAYHRYGVIKELNKYLGIGKVAFSGEVING